MDVLETYKDQRFIWDREKGSENLRKHGVTFQQAMEAISDPLAVFEDASVDDEARQAVIGEDKGRRLLYVVNLVRDQKAWRLISARLATRKERRRYEDAE